MDPILFTLAILLSGSLISALVKKWSGWISTFILLLSLVILLFTGFNFSNRYILFPEFDLSFEIRIDKLSFLFASMILFISSLASFFSIDFMKKKKNRHFYFSSLILFATGMYGITLSLNLLQFYIFWELMIIPAFFLIAYWGHNPKVAFTFFVFMHAGALLILTGIFWLYVETGNFSLIQMIQEKNLIPLEVSKWICLLFLLGFSVKMAIVPLHVWLPDAHSEAPAPISAMLSGLMIGVGGFAIARIVLPLFSEILLDNSIYLTSFALLTMFYGGLMALAQNDVKRLLAYSSISQMGYVFFGLFSSNDIAYLGSLLQIFNHALVKALLFFHTGVLMYSTGRRDLREFGGLMKRMPLTASTCLIAALALSGIPLFNMFVSEWLIFQGSLMEGRYLSTAMSISMTFLTLAYSLWMIKRIFFGKMMGGKIKEPTLKFKLVMLILGILIIFFGIWPAPIINLLR